MIAVTTCLAFLSFACGEPAPPSVDETPDAGDVEKQDAGEELPGEDVQAQVPSPPRDVVATAGNGRATVSWTEPATNGGRAVTGYVLTVSDGTTYEATRTNLLVEGLTNGTAYTFRVVARNAIGDSAPSETSNPVTPFTVPGAPSEVVATPGMASAQVSWLPPADDGGSPVTGYVVAASNGTTRVVSGTSFDYPGLLNGATYTFVVHAINAAGQGAASAASNPVTPISVPGAPTGVLAERGDAKAIVSWVAPLSDGGSPVTHYVVTASDGATRQSETTTVEFDELVLGAAYTFTVVAFNAYGGGPVSIPSNEVVTITVPGPPRDVVAHRGDGNVTLEWQPPLSDGGSRIALYTVHCSDGRSMDSGSTELYVEELTNGEPYTFTVVAVNTVGEGPASEPSEAVIPATVPGPPTDVVVTRGNGSLTLTWNAPEWDGGSPVGGYVVRENFVTNHGVVGNTLTLKTQAQGGTLTVGFDYAFTVVAVNDVGEGASSIETDYYTVITRPTPPVTVTAERGNGSATVSWTPGWDGGGGFAGYRVTSSEGTTWETLAPPLLVEGLVNGTAYTFTVTTLSEELGESDPSPKSNAVTPATLPKAPVDVTATAGLQSAQVAWTAPDDGGSPIVNYIVTTVPMPEGRVPVLTQSTSLLVERLDSETAYSFIVEAVNELGTSPASAPSNEVVPADVPSPPLNVIATLEGTTARIRWTAPTSDGGSDILGYQVFSSAQSEPFQTTALELTIEGLARGQSLSFTVQARNAYGLGTLSEVSNEVFLPDVPAAITEVTAMAAGAGTVLVTWAAPFDGGSPIIDYEVASSAGTHVSTEASFEVTGLTGGTTYSFTVRARNSVGYGPAGTSDTVMAVTPPSAARSVVAVLHDTGMKVSWQAPTSTGGKAIQNYVVKLGGLTEMVAAPATTITFVGLTEFSQYTPKVTALNEVGESVEATGAALTYIDREWAQWAVPATPAYTVVGDVVRATGTGLEWQRVPTKLSWSAAKTYCDNLTLGGSSDWRLPTYIELASIVDFSRSPTIDTTAFAGTFDATDGRYWTASTYAPTSTSAWIRRFETGERAQAAKTVPLSVRCVR